jgi:hypothetical protein
MEAATLPEAAAEAVMEAVAEAAMEVVKRAAIEEATGIQSESGSESASENVGFSPRPYMPTGGRDSREPVSARRTCLRTCPQQRRTSRTALEVLFYASASLRRGNKRHLEKEGRSRYKK